VQRRFEGYPVAKLAGNQINLTIFEPTRSLDIRVRRSGSITTSGSEPSPHTGCSHAKATSGGDNERVDLPHWIDRGDHVHSFISRASLSETATSMTDTRAGFASPLESSLNAGHGAPAGPTRCKSFLRLEHFRLRHVSSLALDNKIKRFRCNSCKMITRASRLRKKWRRSRSL